MASHTILPQRPHRFRLHEPVPINTYQNDPLLYKDNYIFDRMQSYGRTTHHQMRPHARLFLLEGVKFKSTAYAQPLTSEQHSIRRTMQRQRRVPPYVNL